MNSHIQLPNFVLEKFKGSNGRVAYLDLQDLKIHCYSAGKLGTEENYYSAEMEAFLNKERETPFSRLATKVMRFVEGELNTFTLTSEDELICKRFLTTIMARSNLALEAMMNKSVFAQFLPDQTNHDFMVYYGSTLNNGIVKEISNYNLMILANRTERSFVVPRNFFYLVQNMGTVCINLPISPFCALQLIPQNSPGCYLNGKECRYRIVDDPNTIIFMNNAALKYEYSFNKQFVASWRRTELEKLQVYAEEHRKELNDSYNALHSLNL